MKHARTNSTSARAKQSASGYQFYFCLAKHSAGGSRYTPRRCSTRKSRLSTGLHDARASPETNEDTRALCAVLCRCSWTRRALRVSETFCDKNLPNLQVPCQPEEKHRQVSGEGVSGATGTGYLCCHPILRSTVVPCVAGPEGFCDRHTQARFLSFVIQCTSTTTLNLLTRLRLFLKVAGLKVVSGGGTRT